MVCYCWLYFGYVVRGNVCDMVLILFDILDDNMFFCYIVSCVMLFLVDFGCGCCWFAILLSNLPGKKKPQWILLQINLEK